ncbi:MAG: MBL fold metallo-hydrolase [Coriobacteriales bacterium]|jgi:competence protein ComEC|nr:MBL fold metallo-hydrolase [Coriobacteriales bacterium]
MRKLTPRSVKHTRRPLAAALLGLATLLSAWALATFLPTAPAPPGVPDTPLLTVVFLDVGQADAALVSCEGHYMLIDGGNAADSSLLYSALQRRGIGHLDAIVFSHSDEDHIGGLAGALEFASLGTCYGPTKSRGTKAFASFTERLERRGVAITVPTATATFMLGSATVRLWHLDSGTGDPNDNELVAQVTYGEDSFLFTGDIGFELERMLVDGPGGGPDGGGIASTVMKVPHHGSANSSSYLLLREANPRYAVISVGARNSYGHPTDEALSRYRDLGCELYRTDLHGDITVTSTGSGVSVATQKTTGMPAY